MTVPLPPRFPASLASEPIFVSGHRGMVGSAIVRALQTAGARRIVVRSREELDLTRQGAVEDFYRRERPRVVLFAAGRVGGIHANATYPADFMRDNLTMAVQNIHAAYAAGVERFLYLGSTCIYPRLAPQPIEESALLSGPLEPTNEAYAVAKIAGLKMCQFYRQQYGVLFHSAMPTNLYGPGDNYHPRDSHVLPALLRRLHEARQSGAASVAIWGSGAPRREFLHVDDLASGILFLLGLDDPPDWVNLGTGEDLSIADLAQMIAEVVGYRGRLEFDRSRPDGTPVKCSDVRRMQALGWRASIPLREGLEATYRSFVSELEAATIRQ